MSISRNQFANPTDQRQQRAQRVLARVRRQQLASALAGDMVGSARFARRARRVRNVLDAIALDCEYCVGAGI